MKINNPVITNKQVVDLFNKVYNIKNTYWEVGRILGIYTKEEFIVGYKLENTTDIGTLRKINDYLKQIEANQI